MKTANLPPWLENSTSRSLFFHFQTIVAAYGCFLLWTGSWSILEEHTTGTYRYFAIGMALMYFSDTLIIIAHLKHAAYHQRAHLKQHQGMTGFVTPGSFLPLLFIRYPKSSAPFAVTLKYIARSFVGQVGCILTYHAVISTLMDVSPRYGLSKATMALLIGFACLLCTGSFLTHAGIPHERIADLELASLPDDVAVEHGTLSHQCDPCKVRLLPEDAEEEGPPGQRLCRRALCNGCAVCCDLTPVVVDSVPAVRSQVRFRHDNVAQGFWHNLHCILVPASLRAFPWLTSCVLLVRAAVSQIGICLVWGAMFILCQESFWVIRGFPVDRYLSHFERMEGASKDTLEDFTTVKSEEVVLRALTYQAVALLICMLLGVLGPVNQLEEPVGYLPENDTVSHTRSDNREVKSSSARRRIASSDAKTAQNRGVSAEFPLPATQREALMNGYGGANYGFVDMVKRGWCSGFYFLCACRRNYTDAQGARKSNPLFASYTMRAIATLFWGVLALMAYQVLFVGCEDLLLITFDAGLSRDCMLIVVGTALLMLSGQACYSWLPFTAYLPLGNAVDLERRATQEKIVLKGNVYRPVQTIDDV